MGVITILNEEDMDVIHKIVEFGGYATTRILCQYIKDSDRNLRNILATLEKEKLIRRIESSRNPTVHNIFQVTKKACVLCNRGESYMWKMHTLAFIARSLIRSHFLFSITGSSYRQIHSSHAAKVSFLMSKGFDGEHLPHKYNDGIPVLQIKEYLLSGEPYSHSDGFCIVHPDKGDITAMTQLKTLLKRYEKMLVSNKCPICFLAICENRLRANEFVLAGQKLTGNKRGINGGIGGNTPLVTGFSIKYHYY